MKQGMLQLIVYFSLNLTILYNISTDMNGIEK